MAGENRFTALAVKRAGPGRHADGGSLYLDVAATGARRWLYRYRTGEKVKDMALGNAAILSLKDARDLRDRWRRELTFGRDPVETRRAEKAAGVTFGEVADEVIALKQRDLRNDKAAAQWKMTLTVYSESLRGKPIAEIATADVLAVIRPLWSRIPDTAWRLRGRIERVIDHGRAHGHVPADAPNPARWRGHLQLLLGARRTLTRGNHAALAYEDAPGFMGWLGAKESVSARALEWTILTAARTGETIGALKSEINLVTGVWTIPAGRMKAGRHHRVPLSDSALAIAKDAMNAKGDYLFPGRKGKPLSNMAMSNLLKRHDSNVTVHGFRATFKSWAEDQTDCAREVIEAALAHVIGDKAEQAYRRSDALDKRRPLMQQWAGFMAAPRKRQYNSRDEAHGGNEEAWGGLVRKLR